MDLPPDLPPAVACCIQAADNYKIPREIVLAVAQTENGRAGLWVQNTNKTFDVGPMQFNTAWLKSMKKHGIDPEDVEAAGCYPYELAAWRLKTHIDNDKGDIWTRVANYHSRTPKFNQAYQQKLYRFYSAWVKWFKNPTLDSIPWTGRSALPERKVVLTKAKKQEKPVMTFEDYLRSKGF